MQRFDMMNTLKDILKILNRIWEDDQELLSIFFREISLALKTTNVFLAFIDKDKKGEKIKFIDREPDRFSRTIITQTMEKDASIFIPDTSMSAHVSESVGHIGIRSVFCVPFHCSDTIDGVFYLDRSLQFGPFDQEERWLVEVVCEQLAHIVRNSRFHRQKIEEKVWGAKWREELHMGMVGNSPQMLRIFAEIRALKDRADSTVLLVGETGTGKEMIARAIHYGSSRCNKAYVALNCAAMPLNLLESELFGYEPGAFSGAHKRKIGRLELAQGGTLLLDELSDIPMETQVKLLRVLQEREFTRLGGTMQIRLDIRIIAASNQDPGDAVGEGKMRLDFYQRLAVHIIHVPPLRERPQDILALTKYFVAQKSGYLKGLSEKAWQKLQEYDWPGNVRELENTIERAVFLAKDQPLIDSEHIRLYYLPTPATMLSARKDQIRILKEIFGTVFTSAAGQIPANKKVKNLENFIWAKLQDGEQVTSQQLQEGSGYEKRSVQKILKKFALEGKIHVISGGRGTCYQLKADAEREHFPHI